jgi:hypothetical protein
MQLIPRCFLFLLPVLLSGAIAAQDSASALSVQGDVQKPTRWSMEELKAQFANQVQSVNFTTGKDKQTKVCKGIPILSVIQAAALKTDKAVGHHDLIWKLCPDWIRKSCLPTMNGKLEPLNDKLLLRTTKIA